MLYLPTVQLYIVVSVQQRRNSILQKGVSRTLHAREWFSAKTRHWFCVYIRECIRKILALTRTRVVKLEVIFHDTTLLH